MGEAYTVLEIAGSATAPCGRLLAEAGAEVILIEPPGGAPSRQREPFLGPAASPVSAYALFHDRGKRSLTLDLDADAGRAAFRDLVATADVVLESDPPGTLARRGLDYAALAAQRPGLVLVSITPFGQDGPYRDYVGGDFVTFALGGLMFISGERSTRPPPTPRSRRSPRCGAATPRAPATGSTCRRSSAWRPRRTR
jgi:benzylsuccinate CoA-transferase BbsE subunit